MKTKKGLGQVFVAVAILSRVPLALSPMVNLALLGIKFYDIYVWI